MFTERKPEHIQHRETGGRLTEGKSASKGLIGATRLPRRGAVRSWVRIDRLEGERFERLGGMR